MKPYLLVDVDGVLAPVVYESAPPGFEMHTVRAFTGSEHDVWLNHEHGAWLRTLAELYELVWATGWEHEAPRLLGPLLGLPEMPVIEFTHRPIFGVPLWKLPDVIEFVGDKPVAWIDDDIDVVVEQWAAERAAATLLLRTDRETGLTREHVERLVEFAEGVPGG